MPTMFMPKIYAVPSEPFGNGYYRRFWCRHGRIPTEHEKRQGGVWRFEKDNRGRQRIYLVCPSRKCKKILDISWVDVDDIGRQSDSDSCIRCCCELHIWVYLEGYEQAKKP